jgi:hypothetical protein
MVHGLSPFNKNKLIIKKKIAKNKLFCGLTYRERFFWEISSSIFSGIICGFVAGKFVVDSCSFLAANSVGKIFCRFRKPQEISKFLVVVLVFIIYLPCQPLLTRRPL